MSIPPHEPRPDDRCDECQGWRFDRHELSGALGDLGTLLPIAIGLILINGLDATAVLLLVGLYYVASGLVFRTTVPVQPMKVIGAYGIALALTPAQISAAGFWLGVLLLLLALTGAVGWVARVVPRSTVRGVQLTTGVLLMTQGIRFMLGESALQQLRGVGEPFLTMQSLGPLPLGPVLGAGAALLILLLLDNRRAPAALVVVVLGALLGLALGGFRGLADVQLGLHLPRWLPYGLPTADALVLGLTALALPQIPMTVGNAIIAQHDLTREYFGPEVARRMSPRALALSMGLINLAGAGIGAMPMCHGAGGLAAHYRFGARTGGSNLMIGGLFVLVAVLLGDTATAVLACLPFAVLGALLLFAGCQLALMILDVRERRDLFVVVIMLGVSLAANLAWGFGVGILLAYALKLKRLKV